MKREALPVQRPPYVNWLLSYFIVVGSRSIWSKQGADFKGHRARGLQEVSARRSTTAHKRLLGASKAGLECVGGYLLSDWYVLALKMCSEHEPY